MFSTHYLTTAGISIFTFHLTATDRSIMFSTQTFGNNTHCTDMLQLRLEHVYNPYQSATREWRRLYMCTTLTKVQHVSDADCTCVSLPFFLKPTDFFQKPSLNKTQKRHPCRLVGWNCWLILAVMKDRAILTNLYFIDTTSLCTGNMYQWSNKLFNCVSNIGAADWNRPFPYDESQQSRLNG